MPGWILTLIFIIGTSVLYRLFAPRPEGPTASGLGDFVIPTATEDRPIPVIYGTVNVKGPNVVWYGDLLVRPIKVSGGLFQAKIRVGNRYEMGEQLTIGHGVLDELQEIRFDDRSIPGSTIGVSGSHNVIRFGDAFSTYSASIPPGIYTSLTSLAIAAEAAMIAAYGPSTWKVIWGYDVVPGRSDEVAYSVKIGAVATNYTVHVAPGYYATGDALGIAIAAAMNANEASLGGGARVTFACTYDGTKFTISATALVGGLDGWWLRGIVDYGKTILATIGIQYGQDYFHAGFPTSQVSDYVTGAKRFVIAFGGLAGRLHLEDPLFTAASLLGFIPSGSYYIIRSHVADFDKDLAGSRIYDMGDYWSVVVNQPDLFGGDDSAGGVVGTFDVYKGTLTQVANDYLVSVLGPLPAYRGVSYAVSRRAYLGTSAYLKTISFVVRRCPNGLGIGGGMHNIAGDANPACALFDMYTDKRWGRGRDPAEIDTASFLAAGATLFAEGMGVSIVFDKQATAGEMMQEICRLIDGVVYPDPVTAKMVLKLARADYVVGALPTLTVGQEIGPVKIARPSWGDTVNDVRIKFVDRATWMERIAQAQNLANIDARGEMVAEEFDFRGISSPVTADKVAVRVLKTVSYPLARMELPVNRLAYAMRPGDVFKLNDADHGITGMVCRVNRIKTGDLGAGKISIDAVEDIFAVNGTGYTAIGGSGWVDPALQPDILATQEIVEAPYAQVGGANRHLMTFAGRGARAQAGYKVWSDPTGGAAYTETNDVAGSTAYGELYTALGYAETEIVIDPGADVDAIVSVSDADLAAGRSLIFMDGEFLAFKTITDSGGGLFTLGGVVRGVMDTTPRPHAAGVEIWFISEAFGTVTVAAYGGDVTVSAKMRPYTASGEVALESAIALVRTTISRAQRPYVPTAVTLNGASYPASIDGSVFTVAWSHRNRLGSWSYADAGATAAIEAGCTYTVKLYGEDGTLKHTEAGIAGTSFAWANEIADSGLGRINGQVRVTVECINGGAQSSYQIFDYTVQRSGFGTNFGEGFQ